MVLCPLHIRSYRYTGMQVKRGPGARVAEEGRDGGTPRGVEAGDHLHSGRDVRGAPRQGVRRAHVDQQAGDHGAQGSAPQIAAASGCAPGGPAVWGAEEPRGGASEEATGEVLSAGSVTPKRVPGMSAAKKRR